MCLSRFLSLLCVVGLCHLAISATLSAQSGNGREVPTVTLRILPAVDPQMEFFYMDGNTERRLHLSHANPSQPLVLPLQRSFRIHSYVVDEDGNQQQRLMAELPMDPDWNDIILLLRPTPSDATLNTPLQLLPLPFHDSEVGPGAYAMINLSGKRVAGMLHNKSFTLEPPTGSSVTIQPNHDGRTVLILRTAYHDGSEWERIPRLDTRWGNNNRYRFLVIFLHAPNPDYEDDIAITRIVLPPALD